MNPAIPIMLLTQFIWGLAPVFVRDLSLALGPEDAIIARYSIVSIIFLSLLITAKRKHVARKDWLRLGLASFIGIFGYNVFSSNGFAHVGAGLGGLIIGTQPLIIAIMGAIFAREPLTRQALLGLAIAFAGITLIFWQDLAQGNLGLLSGAIMIFCAGLCWAIYVMISRPLIREYGTLAITAWITILAAPMMWALADDQTLFHFQNIDTKLLFALLYMVLLSNFVAGLCWNYASARLSAAVAGAFIYLVPVIAVIAGALMRDEIITMQMLAGGGLVLSGVALTQQAKPKEKSA